MQATVSAAQHASFQPTVNSGLPHYTLYYRHGVSCSGWLSAVVFLSVPFLFFPPFFLVQYFLCWLLVAALTLTLPILLSKLLARRSRESFPAYPSQPYLVDIGPG